MSTMKRQQRILQKNLDPNCDWSSIGIDLAKNSVTIVGVTKDTGTAVGVDILSREALYELAASMKKPTVFTMEPCTGYPITAAKLESYGHTVRVIQGQNVAGYVATHMAGQKTDLNDAQALAFLANDDQLTSVRCKSTEDRRLLSIETTRRLLVKQRTMDLTSFKGTMQHWEIIIPRGTSSIKKFRKLIDENADGLGAQLTNSMRQLVDAIENLNRQIRVIEKQLNVAVAEHSKSKLLDGIPAVGVVTKSRLLATIGDIGDFPRPRCLQAYFGFVPRNMATGHNGKVGRMTKHGDIETRMLMVQLAHRLVNACKDGRMPDCGLRRWIDKKLAMKGPKSKTIVALAAKMVRIVWAIMTHGTKFSLRKAGLSKEALKALAAVAAEETKNEMVEVEIKESDDEVTVIDPPRFGRGRLRMIPLT